MLASQDILLCPPEIGRRQKRAFSSMMSVGTINVADLRAEKYALGECAGLAEDEGLE